MSLFLVSGGFLNLVAQSCFLGICTLKNVKPRSVSSPCYLALILKVTQSETLRPKAKESALRFQISCYLRLVKHIQRQGEISHLHKLNQTLLAKGRDFKRGTWHRELQASASGVMSEEGNNTQGDFINFRRDKMSVF